jgi:hypothetical protein
LSGVISARNTARLAGLWALLAGLRLLAALPITEPRIFRDELLHWRTARAFAAHEPFRFFGQAIDYLAVLYSALLSILAVVVPSGFEAICPTARLAHEIGEGLSLPVVVLQASRSGCGLFEPAGDEKGAVGIAPAQGATREGAATALRARDP